MKKTDYAYIAGLFDGEGCIHISKRKSGYYQLRIVVSNTNEMIIRWLGFAFTGCVWGKKPKGNRRASWTWGVSDRKAEAFLKLIHPYLILKKPEAELAFKFMQTKVPQNSGGKIPPQTVLQEAQRVLMQALKK